MSITRTTVIIIAMLASIYVGLYSTATQASVTYTLAYTPKALNSQQNLPSLKQALVKLMVYVNGIPIGIMYRKTDDHQQINLQGPYDVKIISVNVSLLTDDQKNIECLGTALPNQILLQIECLPKVIDATSENFLELKYRKWFETD